MLYGIDKTDQGGGGDTIFLDITQCATPAAAEQKMKDYLSSFQSSLDKVVQKAQARLGSYALQSDACVFWIRDTVFVNVSGEEMNVQKGE